MITGLGNDGWITFRASDVYQHYHRRYVAPKLIVLSTFGKEE
jgi:hypothetical protein